MLSLSSFQFVSGRPSADVISAPTEEEKGEGQGEEIQSN